MIHIIYAMLTDVLIKIFKRDLNKLKVEIETYSDENNMWLLTDEINNSAGNLCLHIIGNLNHFIGAVLGETRYIRERDLEFSLKDVAAMDLINQIDEVELVVEMVLATLTVENLESRYPIDVFKSSMTTEFFLIHLTTHLSYHLGQINYHRQLLDT
ncbi:MAG: DinB family protein [Algibacter sp.]